MIKTVLAFFAALSFMGAAQMALADPVAYARFSPLPVFDANSDAATGGSLVKLPFGQPYPIIETRGDMVVLTGIEGQTVRVRLADVVLASSTSEVSAGPGYAVSGRPSLIFWDSPTRAQAYLQGQIAPRTRPVLEDVPESLALAGSFRLPLLGTSRFESLTGQNVVLASGLAPLMPEVFSPPELNKAESARPLTLHVLVDGSDYAREFALRELQTLSRQIAALSEDLGRPVETTRAVFFDTGHFTASTAVPISGLRATLPASGDQVSGRTGLSSAFLALWQQTVADLASAPNDGSQMFVILAGPGLQGGADIADRAARLADDLQAYQDAGHEVQGVVFAQVTPEPSTAARVILDPLSSLFPQRRADFGADLVALLSEVSQSARPKSGDADLRKARCTMALSRGLPCILPTAEEVSDLLPKALRDKPLDWVAMPVWFLVDGSTVVAQDRATPVAAGTQPDAGALADCLTRVARSGNASDLAQCLEDHPEGATLLSLAGSLQPDARTNQALKDAYRRLEAELEAQSDELRAVTQQNRILNRNLEVSVTEKNRSVKILAGLQEDRDRLQGQVADLLGTKRKLEATADALNRDIARLSDDVARQQDTIAAREQQAGSLAADLRSEQAASARLTRTLADKTAELAQNDADRKGLERMIASLTAGLQQKDQQIAGLGKDIDRLDAKIVALSAENQAIEAARAETEALLVKAEGAVRALQQDYDAVMADLSARTAELAQSSSDLAALRTDRDAKAEALALALADLAREQDAGQTREAEMAALTLSRDDLSQALSEVESDLEDMTRREAAAVAQNADLAISVRDLKGLATVLQDNLANLQDAMTRVTQERDTQIAEGQQLQAALAAMTGERDTLLAEGERLSLSLVAMTQERDALLTNEKRLTQSLATITQERDVLVARSAEMAASMAVLQRENTQGAESLAALRQSTDAERSDLVAQLTRTSEEVARLEARDRELEAEIAAARAHLPADVAGADIGQTEEPAPGDVAKSVTSVVAYYEDAFQKATARAQEASDRLATAERSADADRARLSARIATLVDDIARLTATNRSLNEDRAAALSANQTLIEERAAANAARAALLREQTDTVTSRQALAEEKAALGAQLAAAQQALDAERDRAMAELASLQATLSAQDKAHQIAIAALQEEVDALRAEQAFALANAQTTVEAQEAMDATPRPKPKPTATTATAAAETVVAQQEPPAPAKPVRVVLEKPEPAKPAARTKIFSGTGGFFGN